MGVIVKPKRPSQSCDYDLNITVWVYRELKIYDLINSSIKDKNDPVENALVETQIKVV